MVPFVYSLDFVVSVENAISSSRVSMRVMRTSRPASSLVMTRWSPSRMLDVSLSGSPLNAGLRAHSSRKVRSLLCAMDQRVSPALTV